MDINTVYQFLVHLNPIIMIIIGVVVLIAGKFAKWIAIGAIILGVILLLVPYLLKII